MADIKSTALWEAIQALTRLEVNSLRRWLQSPFFNHKPELVKLLEELDSQKNTNGPLEKAKIFEAVFPKEKVYKDALMRHVMSFLLQQIRQFWTWQEWMQTPNHHQVYEVRALRKRNLEKNFSYCYKQAMSSFEGSTERQLDDGHQQFLLQYEYFEWESRRRRAQEFQLEELANNLGTYYAAHLFRLACVVQSQGALFTQAVQLPLFEALIKGFPESQLKSDPLSALYFHGYQMFSQPEDGQWTHLFRSSLEEYLYAVPSSETRDLLMLAINYCIRRINQGDRNFLLQALDWYEWGLSRKVLFDDSGALSPYTYNNVLMLALALQDWPRAEAFLEQYRSVLPASDRENVYRYNLSVYLFRKGDYDGALSVMRDVSFRDPMYYLESRKMLLKIYFDQGAIDALEPLLESLQAWLRRHAELGYHREMYRNLARFTRQLLYLSPSDQAGKRLLEKNIAETPLLAEREWLLEKLKKR